MSYSSKKIKTIYANFCSDSSGLPKTSFLFDKEQGGALNDMTMQIQDFIDDVKNGKVQSEKHCLEDTKKILEVSEMM